MSQTKRFFFTLAVAVIGYFPFSELYTSALNHEWIKALFSLAAMIALWAAWFACVFKTKGQI